MFYSYKNSNVRINGRDLQFTDASINIRGDQEPVYSIPNRNSTEFVPNDGIGGSLKLTYYLTGNDILKPFITNESSGISGNFGGLFFSGGYLKNYSLNCTPNNPVQVNAELVFFDELKGVFAPTYQTVSNFHCLNYADASLTLTTGNSIGDITNATRIAFNYNVEIVPVYAVGDILPERIFFGKKEITAEVECDNLSGNLLVSGNRAGIKINFAHPSLPNLSESFLSNGILHTREIGASQGSLLKSVLSIRQQHTNNPPVISYFQATGGAPGGQFFISGQYLLSTNRVEIGSDAATFIISGDDLLGVYVPEGAVNGNVKVTNADDFTISSGFSIIQRPITISGIDAHTGEFNKIVRISGDNFHKINLVTFSGAASDFKVINSKLIEAAVPLKAAWGTIQVASTDRTLTGTSTGLFVPVPVIYGFSGISGYPGDTINVSGFGFVGVTGVYFNNITGSPVSVSSISGLSAVLPTGNTKGLVALIGRSGVSGHSTFEFTSLLRISGLDPLSGATGSAVRISGVNFAPTMLFSSGSPSNNALLAFNGGTGALVRVSDILITGLVPTGAKTGPIYIFKPDGVTTYPSGLTFKVYNDPPTITLIDPNSGVRGDNIAIHGKNFFDIDSFLLTGINATTGYNFPSTGYNASEFGDVLTFNVPSITGGIYRALINAARGGVSGFFTIKDKPFISGFYNTSGFIGQRISLSGSNIYRDSRVYLNTTGTSALVDTGSYVATNSKLEFFIPTNALSTNTVIVYNGADYHTGTANLTVINKPVISGFKPASGEWGDVISVSGLYLNGTTGMLIGTSRVNTFRLDGTTGAAMTIPDDAATNHIFAQTVAGEAQSSGRLVVLQPQIIISGFIPTSGRTSQKITVSGKYVSTTDYVRISGINSSEIILNVDGFSKIGTTDISFNIPVGAVTGPIRLQNQRYITNSASNLVVIPSPTITGASQVSGIFNESISLFGANLTGVSEFLFVNPTGGYTPAINTTLIGGTGATITFPKEVTQNAIILSGENDILGYGIEFTPLPTIGGFRPTTLQSGDNLTVTGINATNIIRNVGISGSDGTVTYIISSDDIFIDDYNITGAQVINCNTGYVVVTGRVNANYFGSGRIFLISASDSVSGNFDAIVTGSATHARMSSLIHSTFLTIQQGTPTISDFTPLSGNNDILVRINGSNLKYTTGIYFRSGNVVATGFLGATNNSFVNTYPPANFGATSGQVEVYTNYGAATGIYFTFVPRPLVSGFTPIQGISGVKVRITGSGFQYASGVYFDRYPVSFNIVSELNTHVITGTVPYMTEAMPREIGIKVMTPGGEHTLSGFTVQNPFLKFVNLSDVPNTITAQGYVRGSDDGQTLVFRTTGQVLTDIGASQVKVTGSNIIQIPNFTGIGGTSVTLDGSLVKISGAAGGAGGSGIAASTALKYALIFG
jgi:hypothetical protein